MAILRSLILIAILFPISVFPEEGSVSSVEKIKYGVYGKKWLPWVKKNSDDISLYIYQMPLEPGELELSEVGSLLKTDVELFFVQSIHESRRERWMHPGAKADKNAAVVGSLLSENYSEFTREHSINISLDEENFWWKGRGEYLDAIYKYAKGENQSLGIWQFFAEGLRTQRRNDRLDRFKLSTDGYIFDEYRLASKDYELLLKEYVSQGKPVISILWASPNWNASGRKVRKPDNDWWDAEGWRSFYEKTMINRKHGVSTAYFIYDIGGEEDKFRLVPTFSGNDVCSAGFVKKLFKVTLPRLFLEPIVTESPTLKPDWVTERCPNN